MAPQLLITINFGWCIYFISPIIKQFTIFHIYYFFGLIVYKLIIIILSILPTIMLSRYFPIENSVIVFQDKFFIYLVENLLHLYCEDKKNFTFASPQRFYFITSFMGAKYIGVTSFQGSYTFYTRYQFYYLILAILCLTFITFKQKNFTHFLIVIH